MPLIFRHGAAETAFIVAVAAWVVFEFVMRMRQRLRASGPPAWDRSALVLLPCLGAAVALAQVLGRRGRLPWPGGLVWPVVAGVVLIAAGIGLRAWSIATLGRFFQYWIKVQPGHRAARTGTCGIPPTPGSRWYSPGSRWPVMTSGAWRPSRSWAQAARTRGMVRAPHPRPALAAHAAMGIDQLHPAAAEAFEGIDLRGNDYVLNHASDPRRTAAKSSGQPVVHAVPFRLRAPAASLTPQDR